MVAMQPPEPKAQPPRKRSGKRTAKAHGRWKVAPGFGIHGAPTEQGRTRSGDGRNLSGFRTAGARRRRSYRRNPRPGDADMSDQALKTTPLNAAHRALGARMVGFGGYDMPV